MRIKRSTGPKISLLPAEQALLRTLVKRYRDSLDILAEPRYNEMVRRCGQILQQLR